MSFLRIVLFAVILLFPRIVLGQHVALHWYVFQSLLPLTAEEGKEALVLIREHTSDSLSTFTDKNDFFSLASRQEENLNDLAEELNDAGFYLIDITNPRLENSFVVRMTKGFQYAQLCWAEPLKFENFAPDEIVLQSDAKSLLSQEQRAIVESNPRFIQKQE